MPSEVIDVVAEALKGAGMLSKANGDQKRVINSLLELVDPNSSGPSRPVGNCFFMAGEGGTGSLRDSSGVVLFNCGLGKTFTYEALYHTVRGLGELCITMASTGCAATLLPGGRTVHNVFDVPVPTYSDTESRVDAVHPPTELKKAKVFIIDEAPMLCKYVLEAVDRKLRLIQGKPNLPFGGVVMLLGKQQSFAENHTLLLRR